MNNKTVGDLPVIWVILMFLAGLVTGLIHLIQKDPILMLNGLGYFALLAVACLPLTQFKPKRRSAIDTLLVYAFATFMLYFLTSGAEAWENQVALIAKSSEFVLMLLIVGYILKVAIQNRPKTLDRGAIPKHDPDNPPKFPTVRSNFR